MTETRPMTTVSDCGDASRSLQFFPVDIGVYVHHEHLETEPEVAAVAALLQPFGARVDPWAVPAEKRDVGAVKQRLEEWSASPVTGDTFMYWVGHGWSNGGSTTLLAHALSPAELTQNGIGPEDLLQSLKARQCQAGAGWAIVVIDACSSSYFVNRMYSKALDDGEARDYLLIATAAEGSTALGAFRRVLSTVLTSTFRTEDTIDFYDLTRELQRNLNGCSIHLCPGDGGAALRRAVPTLAGRMQASLDTVTDIEKVLENLTDDERLHFVPKASGAELGEQNWYFEGRESERRRILAWLDTAERGMLVVTGEAGSGKSALLGHVVVHSRRDLSDILMKHQKLSPLPEGSDPPYGVFDSVLHLTGATPRTVVQRIADSAGLGTPPDTAIGEQCAWLVERFRAVGRGAGGHLVGADASVRFTLLADALDEAHLPLLIAERILGPLADLAGVRIVVGTRRSTAEGPDRPAFEDADLMEALGADRNGNREILSVARDPAAMRQYIRNRLHAARDRLGVEPSQIDRTAEALSNLDREFLYARLAVHEVISNPELAADPTPLLEHDHRQLFARAVERLSEKVPCYRFLLEALALAQGRGLPVVDGVWAGIATALADSPDIAVTDDDIRELTDTAAPYLMLDTESGQSVYRLAHRTFSEHFARTVPPSAHDGRHRRITEYLAEHASPVWDQRPNPYVVNHLPTHAGLAGPAGWQVLADRPRLLDRLSPSAVVASVMLRALGRFELPPTVAGVLFEWEQLATADCRDRRGLRELASLRCTQETVVQRFGRRSSDPDSAWSVRWGQLKGHAPHLRLTGHTGSVQAIVAFRDASGGVLLASGSDDGAVRFWDPARGEAVGDPVTLHDAAVQSIEAFTDAKGRTLLATGGADGTVRIWDPITGETVGEPLTAHDDWVRSVVAFKDADGQLLLATGGGDGTLRVWDPLTGKELAVGGLDEPGTQWDPDTGQETDVLVGTGHDGDVYSVVAFDSLDDQDRHVLLATAGNDGTLRIWDPATGEETTDPLTGHEGAVYSVAAFVGWGGQTLLASGGEDGTVRIWDPDTGRQTRAPLTGHVEPVLAVGTLVEEGEDGARTRLVTVGADNSVRLWDPAGGEQVTAPLTGHEDWVRAVSPVPPLSGAHPLLATGGDDRTLRIWALPSGRPAGVAFHDTATPTRALTSFTGEEGQTLIAAVDADAVLRVFDPAEGEKVDELLTEHDGDVLAVIAVRVGHGDDERLAFGTGGADGVVRLWDPGTGEKTGELVTDHAGGVQALSAFVGFGGRSFLATGGEDGVVRLWDPGTGEKTGELVTDHAGGIRALCAFVGLGGQSLLATAGADGVARRWNLMTGEAVGEPIAHPDLTAIESYRLPNREAMLVTGDNNGTVRFWNSETGAEALNVPLGLPVHDVAFVDGDLALATTEGLVQVSLEAGSNLTGSS
ncbi:WD40 repeat domain-containing protein [Streptomyces sp. NPDC002082]|uniref:WD40 repeat domain-containing protein n=1 Tax=Streptomyces sp. NPDC002082 TaxID=3154772 RepID=UPI003326C32B